LIACIILARGGSKGIPYKNTINFCGKPLIVWTIEQAKRSKLIDKIYVSTDSNKIAEISRMENVEVINRPKYLATDTAISDMALLHAVKEIEKKEFLTDVVNLQCTSPLRREGDIDRAIHSAIEVDSLYSCSISNHYIWDEETSITYNYKSRNNRQKDKPLYWENGSIYVLKSHVIKEYNNRLGGNIGRYVMEPWQSFELDEIEDIELVKFYMGRKILVK
jgi:N-acylneuraminate cytidylyltransferase